MDIFLRSGRPDGQRETVAGQGVDQVQRTGHRRKIGRDQLSIGRFLVSVDFLDPCFGYPVATQLADNRAAGLPKRFGELPFRDGESEMLSGHLPGIQVHVVGVDQHAVDIEDDCQRLRSIVGHRGESALHFSGRRTWIS